MNINGNCTRYGDLVSIQKYTTPQNIRFYLCLNGLLIKRKLVNDLVPDCGPNAEDEPILKSLLKGNHFVFCDKPKELPCRQGHSKSYNVMLSARLTC